MSVVFLYVHVVGWMSNTLSLSLSLALSIPGPPNTYSMHGWIIAFISADPFIAYYVIRAPRVSPVIALLPIHHWLNPCPIITGKSMTDPHEEGTVTAKRIYHLKTLSSLIFCDFLCMSLILVVHTMYMQGIVQSISCAPPPKKKHQKN